MNVIRAAVRGISGVRFIQLPRAGNRFTCPQQFPPLSGNARLLSRSNVIYDKDAKESTENSSLKSTDQTDTIEEKEKWARDTISLSLKERFKIFYDADSKLILDADEIRQLEAMEPESESQYSIYDEVEDEFAGYNLERGVHGVFELEELIKILKHERATDVCVIEVPPELHYTDHLVIVTAMSQRHLKAMVEFLKKLHKRKKSEKDPFVDVGGKTCSDWKVLDLGNIILHIFLQETRQHYDIETLWTVGREFDDLSNEVPDEIYELIQMNTTDTKDMLPLVAINKSEN